MAELEQKLEDLAKAKVEERVNTERRILSLNRTIAATQEEIVQFKKQHEQEVATLQDRYENAEKELRLMIAETAHESPSEEMKFTEMVGYLSWRLEELREENEKLTVQLAKLK